MNQKKKNLINQHRKHLSRRDFISLGLTAAGGVVFAPTLFHALKRSQAFAAGLDPLPAQIPFITFDLAGGAALPGNFLVGGKGGPQDLLGSYSTLGWNPRIDGMDTRFGLPMAKANISKVLTGMLEKMSAGAQANFKMASILHTSQDDSGENALSVAQLVSSSGLVGRSLRNGLGLLQSPSGGRSRSVKEFPDYTVRFTESVEDLLQANAPSFPLINLGTGVVSRVFAEVKKMSMSQANAALSLPANASSLTLLGARLGDAEILSTTGTGLDPRVQPDVAAVYGLNLDTSTTDPTALKAALAFGALSGLTGPTVITINGCDYHDGTQTTGDAKDLEIGREIGRAVELAYRMKKPLFIHIFTDGGIASFSDSRNWQGDNGEKSMSVMGYFNPISVPPYLDSNKVQVGAYTAGQGADRSTFFGASPALAGYSVFANYLSAQNRINDFSDLSDRALSLEQLKQVLVFGS